MNLDDLIYMKELDTLNMLGEISGLPDQLEKAWKLGNEHLMPAMPVISRVVIAGMGGSAIGADLLLAYGAPLFKVPVVVVRDYTLPAWAAGSETLVIASSHSGNTEETLSAFQQATDQGCTRLALCTGGKLAELARATGASVWTFTHHGQPRAAVGFSFGLLLALFSRLELIPDPSVELADALSAMRRQQQLLAVNVPTPQNPAKRQALQLINRWVTVVGSEHLEPVARRWKGQVNELAKAWAQFETLPEADHNTLAGTLYPEALFNQAITIFLSSASGHPRNTLRTELTKQMFMLEGMTTDYFFFDAPSRLAQQWTALLLGDYIAYYLAVVYGVDPTPIEMLVHFKAEMAARG